MSRRAQTGYADLVRLADGSTGACLPELAELFGFERSAPKPEPLVKPPDGGVSTQRPPSSVSKPRLPPAPVPFWQPVGYFPIPVSDELRVATVTPGGNRTVAYPGWRLRPSEAPPFQPLAPWRDLTVRLRHALGFVESGRSIDIDRVVERIGRGEVLDRLPRTALSRWCGRVQIIADRSRRLIPFFKDQRYVAGNIHRLVASHDFLYATLPDGAAAPRSHDRDGYAVDYQWPLPETPVLALGDLGCLAGSGDPTEITGPRRFWLEFGQRLRAAGCRPVALFPAGLRRCPPALAAVWTVVPWERPRAPAAMEGAEVPAERLLRLLSPALRIEPGLLRAVRRLLPDGEADAGVEAEVWQHPWLASGSPAGATIRSEKQAVLRKEFAETVDPLLRKKVARTLRQWRADLPEEIWFRELLSLDLEAQAGVESDDLADARQYEQAFCAELAGGGAAPGRGNDLLWQDLSTAAATRFFWTDKEVGSLLVRLNHRLNSKRPDYRLPPGVTPEQIEPDDPDAVPRDFTVNQVGENLVLDAAPDQPGSLLARLWSRNGLVDVEELSFWKSGAPPPWAKDWGWDEYGAWVTFSVGGFHVGDGARIGETTAIGEPVIQKMRWIPPGRFMMGSPEEEEKEWKDERPQHEVTIGQGFWLFDTACTQALWEAVMGENPSRFKTPDRPVEQVSWDDARAFLKKVNQRLPGLDLSLPSEAQWEYACRAGTTTPFSFGEEITPDQVNYDGNFPYRDGPKGEYRKKTVPVASLPANPWGLYEMHGNVWEWCADAWHGSYEGAPADGRAWESDGPSADRVRRGGSWFSLARVARAACRFGYGPAIRYDFLGFRCARVQVSPAGQAGQQGAEPAQPSPLGQAERSQGAMAASGAASLLRLREEPKNLFCAIPKAPAFHILSDCERLIFRRMTRPPWADAMGRDRFGLWAEFGIGPARQKMRWIPPGRFMMGSPEDEHARIDDRESPRHEVTFKQGFWLFDTACTQALWQAVMGDNLSRFKERPDHPVENVYLKDVQKFLEKINKEHPGLDLTLPSEAQWEYACRAGTTTPFSFGEDITPAQVNYDGKFPYRDGPKGEYRKKTVPVASLPANPWGLYEMHGNVWEWCADAWHANHEGAPTDGSVRDGPSADRVVRGGSWFDLAHYARAACRFGYGPAGRDGGLGFRCARAHDRMDFRT